MADEKKALQGGKIKLGDYELSLEQFDIPDSFYVVDCKLVDEYDHSDRTGNKYLRMRVLNGDLVKMLQKQNMLIDTIMATGIQVDFFGLNSNVDIENKFIGITDLHVFLKWNKDATRYDGLKCTAKSYKEV